MRLSIECYIGPGISSKFWAFTALWFFIEPANMNRGQLYETHFKVTWTTHKTKLIEGLMKERNAVANGTGQNCTWLLARDQETSSWIWGAAYCSLHWCPCGESSYNKTAANCLSNSPHFQLWIQIYEPSLVTCINQSQWPGGLGSSDWSSWNHVTFSCGCRGTTGGDPERTVKRLSLLMSMLCFQGCACSDLPPPSHCLLSTEFMTALLPFPDPTHF